MRTFRFVVTFIVSASVLSFVSFFIIENLAERYIDDRLRTVVVRDVLGPRVHRLSGMVMVPTACHDLLSRTREIDRANYMLIFETWENPNRVCNSEEMPRQFHLTLFAPSTGIALQAKLDDVSIPLEVIPTIE